MVDDNITDGKRIAQLLASELTGLETGSLAGVEVVDADTDVTPTEDGPVAYRVAQHGSVVGTVRVYPERATVALGTADDERDGDAGDVLTVTTGAGVKDAVDSIRATLREE